MLHPISAVRRNNSGRRICRRNTSGLDKGTSKQALARQLPIMQATL